jgi:para-nitrobenzyl esterase
MRAAERLTLTLMLLPLPAVAQQQAAPVVRVTGGSIEGVVAGDVDAFLGVPYAAPPVGLLRWRAPQPPAAWHGIRSARTLGNDCLQDSQSNPLPAGYVNAASEDCLYLNVWRPHRPGVARFPVMLWIHGGAFIMGSGSLPTYDGRALARKGILLVTINYRLGRFGTFANPSLSAEQRGGVLANYGMMDQIAALRWVKANAGAFGGDPDNVTIFGQSAGASSVNFLMVSPLPRGLFSKAIAQSGGNSDHLKPLRGTQDSAENTGLQWARSKGVPDGDVKALRGLPAETVLDAPVRAPAFPIRDGKLIEYDNLDAFRLGKGVLVPYLVGANNYEQSLIRWLPGAAQAMLARLGPQAEGIVARYQQSGVSREQSVGQMWGEQAMVLPARRRAREQASRGAPVWLYRYGFVPEALRDSTPGAGHDAELEMVFATPSPRSRAKWTVTDQKMADLVSNYWVAFAISGNPNMADAPEWPRVSIGHDRLMEFSNAGAAVVADFGRDRLDMLEEAAAP